MKCTRKRKAYLQIGSSVTRFVFHLRKMSFISVRARSMPQYFNHEATFSWKQKENPFHKTKNPQVGLKELFTRSAVIDYINDINSLYKGVGLGQLEFCVF